MLKLSKADQQARIDRLSAVAKQLLQSASVLGREVTVDLLRHLVGDAADVEQDLIELCRLEFLFEKAGGEHLKAGTCLNDHPKWIEAIARIVRDEGQGWLG